MTALNQGHDFGKYSHELLDSEKGAIHMNEGAQIRIALVYPNTYAVGMANLGFQTVYRLFNEHTQVRCERAFFAGSVQDSFIRTLESGERLNRFDVVGFSVSFELDIPNIIRCLSKSGIPLLRGERTDNDPFIIIGGAVAGLNPSPLLPFTDGLLVGEGEGVIDRIGDVFVLAAKDKLDRKETLRALSEIHGFYVPGMSVTVKRQVMDSLDDCPTYTPIVTPLSHFKDMFVVEIGRGCVKGCLFCAARKIYGPCRYRSQGTIENTIETHNPGARNIGLEGAGLSDFPLLESLCETLIGKDYRISLSSLRPDRIRPSLVKIMEKGKIRTVTMAPETGSESLRMRMGKRIADDTIRNAVRFLRDTAVRMIRLYFIIGLPGETDIDIESILHLLDELAIILPIAEGKKRIQISVNAFIPKPFTELQWSPMATEKEISQKRNLLVKGIRDRKGIRLNLKSSKNEILQGALSVGDETVGLAVMDSVIKKIPWKHAMKGRGMNLESLLYRERRFDTDLPWDFIETDIPKQKLWKNYQNVFKP